MAARKPPRPGLGPQHFLVLRQFRLGLRHHGRDSGARFGCRRELAAQAQESSHGLALVCVLFDKLYTNKTLNNNFLTVTTLAFASRIISANKTEQVQR